MKKILVILFLFFSLLASATNYYVAPNGSDSNGGLSTASPMLTLTHAWSHASAGDIIYVRGGTYRYGTTSQVLSGGGGSSGNPITIEAYPNEHPIFNYSNINFTGWFKAIDIQDVDYLTIKGIRVCNINQPEGDIAEYGMWIDRCTNILVDQCEMDHVGGWGFCIRHSCNNIRFLNCDSHYNQDYNSPDPYGGSDGWQCDSSPTTCEGGFPSTNIYYEGCRSWGNSDDGWDTRLTTGNHYWINCWSFWNGYIPETIDSTDLSNRPLFGENDTGNSWNAAGNGEGFKICTSGDETGEKKMVNCVAADNRLIGIHPTPDPGTCSNCSGLYTYNPAYIYNCVAYGAGYGMSNYSSEASGVPVTFRNNIAFNNDKYGDWGYDDSGTTHDHNSDNGFTVTNADFLGVSSVGMDGPRGSNGELPVLNFMKLAVGSDLIHAGVHISGLDYDAAGNAWHPSTPSLGAYEYSESSGNIDLTIEGQTYTSSNTGNVTMVDITRDDPTNLIFRNNSITSVNTNGYGLLAGDESITGTNNNLDGAIITGNKIVWNGSSSSGVHAIMVGYNINDIIRYNYVDKGPYSIVLKSGSSSAPNMVYTSGGISYNIFKCYDISIRVKGVNSVPIYNNTFYDNTSSSEAFIDISYNSSYVGAQPSTGTKIKNNIFYTTTGKHMIRIDASGDLSGFESDYNVYYSETGTPVFYYLGSTKTFAEWQALGYDIHSVVVNPNFVNTTGFVPTTRLSYGTNLGSTWQTGLSTTAVWTVNSTPATTIQNGTWQTGARVYEAEGDIPVTSVSVAGTGGATTITIDNGTLQMIETVLPSDATTKTVTWSVSSGGSYATINSSGLLTAVANGVATVRATANNGVYGERNITISNQTTDPIPVTSFNVVAEGDALTITTYHGTLQFSVINILPSNASDKTVTWSVVAGPGTGSIDSNGLFTASGDGQVEIKATAHDGSGVNDNYIFTISNQTGGSSSKVVSFGGHLVSFGGHVVKIITP